MLPRRLNKLCAISKSADGIHLHVYHSNNPSPLLLDSSVNMAEARIAVFCAANVSSQVKQ